jgi:hypothetical protein
MTANKVLIRFIDSLKLDLEVLKGLLWNLNASSKAINYSRCLILYFSSLPLERMTANFNSPLLITNWILYEFSVCSQESLLQATYCDLTTHFNLSALISRIDMYGNLIFIDYAAG